MNASTVYGLVKRIVFVLSCCSALLICHPAAGQRRVPGFVNQPTISPYVNLFQPNAGGVNNYFNFVRPRLELRQYLTDNSRQAAFDRSMVQQEGISLQREIEAIPEAVLQLRPSTSTGAIRRPRGRFMSFGSFYPSGPPINQRAR